VPGDSATKRGRSSSGSKTRKRRRSKSAHRDHSSGRSQQATPPPPDTRTVARHRDSARPASRARTTSRQLDTPAMRSPSEVIDREGPCKYVVQNRGPPFAGRRSPKSGKLRKPKL
jgi:hypothetical protein